MKKSTINYTQGTKRVVFFVLLFFILTFSIAHAEIEVLNLDVQVLNESDQVIFGSNEYGQRAFNEGVAVDTQFADQGVVFNGDMFRSVDYGHFSSAPSNPMMLLQYVIRGFRYKDNRKRDAVIVTFVDHNETGTYRATTDHFEVTVAVPYSWNEDIDPLPWIEAYDLEGDMIAEDYAVHKSETPDMSSEDFVYQTLIVSAPGIHKVHLKPGKVVVVDNDVDAPAWFDFMFETPQIDGSVGLVAEAGNDYVAAVGEEIVLDAGQSYSPAGNYITLYRWRRLPDYDLIYEGISPVVTIKPMGLVTEEIELAVYDEAGNIAIDRVFIDSPLASGGGVAGPEGPMGPQGEAGPAGEDGAMGPVGPQGEAGVDGEQGPVGPQGEQGIQGEQGLIGPQGEQGVQGEQGIQGEEGPQGPIGLQGARGDVGPAGAQGEQGPAGPQGEKGADGVAGPAGEQGPAGPQGEPGEAGPEGPEGPQGEPGIAPEEVAAMELKIATLETQVAELMIVHERREALLKYLEEKFKQFLKDKKDKKKDIDHWRDKWDDKKKDKDDDDDDDDDDEGKKKGRKHK